MERVSSLESNRRNHALQIRLQDDIQDSPIPPDKQHQLRTTRTDLNSFSALEVQCLFYKGYEATSLAYGEKVDAAFKFINDVPTSANAGHWLPIASNDVGLNTNFANLDNASGFSVGALLWRALLWAAIPYFFLLLVFIGSCWVPPFWLESDARRWNQSSYQNALVEKNPWLEAFLVNAKTVKAFDDNVVAVASLESNLLDQSFPLRLRPNSFDCYVGSTLKEGKILSCQAFLKNENGDLYRILQVTNVQEEISIQVSQPLRTDRLFILMGLTWPKDAEPDSIKKNIRFYLQKGHIND